MKKIIAFLMAVVFIMSSIAVIGVSATQSIGSVEYYGTGLNKDTPDVIPVDVIFNDNDDLDYISIEYGTLNETVPCAKFDILDTFYTNLNCFTIESSLFYTPNYKAMVEIPNRYFLRVDESYDLTYINYPIHSSSNLLTYYADDSDDNGVPHDFWYSSLYSVLSITIHHMVNCVYMSSDYHANYSSFYRTTVYNFI